MKGYSCSEGSESGYKVTFMVRLSSDAWMLTSSAEPIAPPAGWCIMMRVLGMAKRFPFAPAACRRCAVGRQPHRDWFPPWLGFLGPTASFYGMAVSNLMSQQIGLD